MSYLESLGAETVKVNVGAAKASSEARSELKAATDTLTSMMTASSRSTTIVIVGVLAALGGGAWWFMKKRKAKP